MGFTRPDEHAFHDFLYPCDPSRRTWDSNWSWVCWECGERWQAEAGDRGAIGLATYGEYLEDLCTPS